MSPEPKGAAKKSREGGKKETRGVLVRSEGAKFYIKKKRVVLKKLH